jgi:hypothetical protein
MSEERDLETVLADVKAEADTLDRNDATFSVDRVRQFVKDVTKAADEWLTWLSEGDATIRAGKSVDWIRARYEQLRREGHARTIGGRRQYRACFIPRRANIDAAAARGREKGRAARERSERRKAS